MNTRKKILITGCARSGTTYITNLLNVIGLKVGHEILRENGLVSWYNVDQPVYVYKNNIETISPKNSKKYHYGVHNRQPNNKKVSDHINTIFDNGWNEVYDFIIHQVRHPLKVISFIYCIKMASISTCQLSTHVFSSCFRARFRCNCTTWIFT